VSVPQRAEDQPYAAADAHERDVHMSMLTPHGKGGRPRSRSRRGKRRLVVLVVIALLLAAGGGGWWWLNRDSATDTVAATPICPPVVPPSTSVPPAHVTLNVYNGTDRKGLAQSVADQLKKRGFKVAKVANDPLKRKVTGLAEVRSSAMGKDPARSVSAQVGDVIALPDQRKDGSVDLVLGATFKTLRTPADAATALKPTPAPRPSGC
jgi:hypothetical protein